MTGRSAPSNPCAPGGSAPAGAVVCPCAAATRPIDCPAVQRGMRQAWTDSQAGDAANRHEEGGYIVRNADGTYGVERWPRGASASIAPPARDANGLYNGKQVVGEFHTHPNPPVDETGRQWTPGGHPGDWNGIAAENYSDESYIISDGSVWRVSPSGQPTRDASGAEVPMGSRTTLIGN
ncbi:MAG: hypothetical protein ABJD97_17890 [Betaproteobacteria bacterium]